jgi:hypothetical protein
MKSKLKTAVVTQMAGSQPTKSSGNHRKKVKNARRLLYGNTISDTLIKNHVQEHHSCARLGIQSATRRTMRKDQKRLQSQRGREWICFMLNK